MRSTGDAMINNSLVTDLQRLTEHWETRSVEHEGAKEFIACEAVRRCSTELHAVLAANRETQQPERNVRALCHWLQNRGGVADRETHEAFHFGNFCPYEVAATVLRGEPDPRAAQPDRDAPAEPGHLWEAFQGRCTCGVPCESGAAFKAHLARLAQPSEPDRETREVCVHCGTPVRPNGHGDWIHTHGLYRCQSSEVTYGHLAHPSYVPCRADGPNPCLGAHLASLDQTPPGTRAFCPDHEPCATYHACAESGCARAFLAADDHEGAARCSSCGGTGGDSSGPCWDCQGGQLDREVTEVEAAIRRIEESRQSHAEWAEHIPNCAHCTEHGPPPYIQSTEEHQQIVAEYDAVLRVLRGFDAGWVPQSVVEEREGEARADEREQWASWLETWLSAVGPEQPTCEAVIAWLRADRRPFGVTYGSNINSYHVEQQDAEEDESG